MSAQDSTNKSDGGIVAAILGFLSFLTSIWKAVPKESQDKIMNTIADGFDEMLRKFFKSKNNSSGDEKGNV